MLEAPLPKHTDSRKMMQTSLLPAANFREYETINRLLCCTHVFISFEYKLINNMGKNLLK